jgi:hypothetical protein
MSSGLLNFSLIGKHVAEPATLRSSESNDCAVRAVAASTGYSYDDCHAFLALHGRKPRRGTSTALILNERKAEGQFPELGFCVTHVGGQFPPATVRDNGDKLSDGGTWFRGTLRSFCRRFPTGSYLVCVSQHALAVKDGIILDHTFSDLRRVRNAWRVERI